MSFVDVYRIRRSKRQRSRISVQSFRLHTRRLSCGRISGRMNLLANAIDHRHALVVENVQPTSFCGIDVPAC